MGADYLLQLCGSLAGGLKYTVSLFFITVLFSIPIGLLLSFTRVGRSRVLKGYNLINTLISGTSIGLSFLFAITLFAGVRERLENSNIPECMKGFPISLISAGLMSIAFFGFSGLTKGLMA